MKKFIIVIILFQSSFAIAQKVRTKDTIPEKQPEVSILCQHLSNPIEDYNETMEAIRHGDCIVEWAEPTPKNKKRVLPIKNKKKGKK